MIFEIPYNHCNTGQSRTIVFGELGEMQFSEKIHTIMGGVSSSALAELSPELQEIVFRGLVVFPTDEKTEISEAFVMRGRQYIHQ